MQTTEYVYVLNNIVLTDAGGRWLFTEQSIEQSNIQACYELSLEPECSVQMLVLNVLSNELTQDVLTLRQLLAGADNRVFQILARASQVATWQHDHRYCPRCGSSLLHHEKDLAKQCVSCNLLQYPRLSPCVIMLVSDGDYCLLGHGHNFIPGVYSTLAGFIEVGETAEAAVAREVREETGVNVKNVRYFSSQPWPFPHSLMLGFTAEYAGGEINLQEEELADAQWFHVDNLPDLPTSFSISRFLINDFIRSRGRVPPAE
ncbi:NAD(+) diphosphatase [Aliamphritea ceti]|uniref:NAD(+) diphosphatase n=1 Tax=Aliamphritea ceti TaxID=1524258 RepID=UPI0021C412F4|nr:NAD(+) diphosphatase [Aliamphritea ceti]